MDKKEFKVGQVWRQRDGFTIAIADVDEMLSYPVRDSADDAWTLEGNFYHDGQESQRDLIELVQDVAEPVTHTTAAAGAAPVTPDIEPKPMPGHAERGEPVKFDADRLAPALRIAIEDECRRNHARATQLRAQLSQLEAELQECDAVVMQANQLLGQV